MRLRSYHVRYLKAAIQRPDSPATRLHPTTMERTRLRDIVMSVCETTLQARA